MDHETNKNFNGLALQGSDSVPSGVTMRRSALREQRLEQLMDSCQQQVLQQIVGPFGLSTAMFNDVNGGAITTTQNFEKGVTANEADAGRYAQYEQNKNGNIDRDAYDHKLPAKRKAIFQTEGRITSAYTGRELPRDGQTHLDHVRSVKSIETDARANLFMDKNQRVEMANADANLVAAEASINQSMQDRDKQEWADRQRKKDPGKSNAESFGVDLELLKGTKLRADRHVAKGLFNAQFKKQGNELLQTSVGISTETDFSDLQQVGRDVMRSQVATNALRQAMGVLLHEFVSGSFQEIRRIVKSPSNKDSIIDEVIEGLQRVLKRVQMKLREAWEALLEGGVQGFLSNLLTYLINCLITTSAKVVTIIREGMRGLWKAVKMVLSPPPGMPAIEVAREASKIIAGVVTVSLGMLLEESVRALITSVPILAPISDLVAPALSAIATGIMTSLVVYGLDRVFDWLSSTGTELLEAQEAQLEASAEVVARLTGWLDGQYRNSSLYAMAEAEYRHIEARLIASSRNVVGAIGYAEVSIEAYDNTAEALAIGFSKLESLDEELENMLSSYELKNKDRL